MFFVAKIPLYHLHREVKKTGNKVDGEVDTNGRTKLWTN